MNTLLDKHTVLLISHGTIYNVRFLQVQTYRLRQFSQKTLFKMNPINADYVFTLLLYCTLIDIDQGPLIRIYYFVKLFSFKTVQV